MDKPTLEGLPVEMRIQILLHVSDLHSLRSLVLSSPSYHQAYLLVRQKALQNVLEAKYDGLVEIKEALAAVRSKGLRAGIPSNREKVVALLDARRRSEEIGLLASSTGTTRTTPAPDEPTDVAEVQELLQLHSIANFFLDDYGMTLSCPDWMDSDKWNFEVLPLELSRTEKLRFLRAFYRFQAYCNIFGAPENPVDSGNSRPYLYWSEVFSEEEAWRMFFGTLSPWEVEEFGCFWKYCYDRNGERYQEVAEDLLQYEGETMGSLPKHLGTLPSCSVLDCGDLSRQDVAVREALASLGPTFLFKLLREQDYMARRNLVLANGASLTGCYPDCSPREESEQLPLLFPADQFNCGPDLAKHYRVLAELPDAERPNYAWDRIWLQDMDDYYDDIYGEMFVAGHEGRRWEWGYAFWDRQRLIEWNAPLTFRETNGPSAF